MRLTSVVAAVVLCVCTAFCGPHFVNVTKDAGISGDGAAAWCDYDGDGLVDVYISGRLFHNDGNGTFTAVNEQAGLPKLGNGATWGDADNDGDPDLFIWAGPGHLFINNGDGTFTDASDDIPDISDIESRGAAWVDINLDGFLDLYIGGYETWQEEVYPDIIFINRGNATFREHWRQSKQEKLSARGVTCADFDEDGDSDIYVSNYRLQPNLLWRNDGNMDIVNVSDTYGVMGNPKSFIKYTGGISYPVCGHTIGSAWGDLDNDGHLDLFVGNFSHPPDYQDRPQFLKNDGPPDYHFTDRSDGAGLKWQESYASPAFGDYDNDGDLDLFFSTVYGGDHCVLYRNDGDWHFTDVTADAGIQGAKTYQAAWADYDNDGDLDLLTAGKLYENRTDGGHWLKLKLEAVGPEIGTQVRISLGDRILTRQVASSTGEGNQNDPVVHFGLGSHSDSVTAEITWPDGSKQSVTCQPDVTVTVRQAGP
ncbi:MAG: CRTAC1 family protein [Armatimonadota bacterium]